MSENQLRSLREIRLLRRLLPLVLVAGLWGCDDSELPPNSGAAGALPERDHVAELLADNVPFEFDFDLEDVNGQRLSKESLAGQVLIVDVWGTWCPPCRREIPHFLALKRQYGGQGLQVVGLNEERIRDKEAAANAVREFCKAEGVNYPCALITHKVQNQIAEFDGYPTTLFLDRKGTVRLKAVGYHSLPFLQAVVETLLQEKPLEAAAPSDGPAAKPDVQDGQ